MPEIKRVISEQMNAKIVLGLQESYYDKLIDKDAVIKAIQSFQDELILKEGIHLSALISDTNVVLSNQVEPHLVIEFINYPRFPLGQKTFKIKVEDLVIHLMNKFDQNRLVICYHDETLMHQKSVDIDPRIQGSKLN